jgi:hypothetical protein
LKHITSVFKESKMSTHARWIAPLFLLLASVTWGDDSETVDEVASNEASAQRIAELADKYEFFTDATKANPLQREPKPILKYTNAIRGDVFGNVFVWTHEGRPEVIGAIFDFRSEDKFDSELHTLARPTIVAVRDEQTFWKPSKPGVTFESLPGAQAPATTATGRLRQMRDFSRDFTVERIHPEQGKESLRVLPQPIYRYSSPEQEVVDGAIFVFVEGTDPETFLLLEATGGEGSKWRFALARMNIVDFSASYQGKKVWSVAPIEWDTVFDGQEPYAIIRENPRRGLVRKATN